MGGRGAFSGGLLQTGKVREFHKIDNIGEINIIAKNSNSDSKNLPIRSNTSDRVYGILNKDGTPKQLGIYKNHHLKTTIDFPSSHKQYIHANDWGSLGKDKNGEISVRINERTKLTKYEQNLVKNFINYYK